MAVSVKTQVKVPSRMDERFLERKAVKEGLALVTPDTIRVQGLLALPAIYQVVDGKCVLRLLNVSNSPRTHVEGKQNAT